MQSAERAAQRTEDRAGLHEASDQPVLSELLLAKRSGQIAAFIAASLCVDDDGIPRAAWA